VIVNTLSRIVNDPHVTRKTILGPDVSPIWKFYHISGWLHRLSDSLELRVFLAHMYLVRICLAIEYSLQMPMARYYHLQWVI